MNRLHRVMLTIGALVALNGCAQNTPQTNRREEILNSTPEERARQQTRQMTQELALTPEQETAVAAINLTYARQMQPLIDHAQRNRETVQEFRRINAAKEQELRRVLNEQQRRAYEVRKAERWDRARNH